MHLQRHFFREMEKCCTIFHDSYMLCYTYSTIHTLYLLHLLRGSFSLKFVCPSLKFVCPSLLTMSLRLCILVTIPSSQRRKVVQSCIAFSQERVGSD